MKNMVWKQTLSCKGKEVSTVTVTGETFGEDGVFGVTKTAEDEYLARTKKHKYQIDHIPTGLRVYSARYKKDCVALAKELVKEVDREPKWLDAEVTGSDVIKSFKRAVAATGVPVE
jgi:hypothetical protein